MRHTHKTMLMKWKLLLGFTVLPILAAPAWAQETPSQDTSSALAASELAKEISNPVTSLWQLQFQFNNVKTRDREFQPDEREVGEQPLLPARHAGKPDQGHQHDHTPRDHTLPTACRIPQRPLSSDRDDDVRRHDPGERAFARRFRAVDLWRRTYLDIPDRWLRSYTAKASGKLDQLSEVATSPSKFMIAAFAQQWWSFAGDSDRESTSQLNLLPLIYSFFGDGWSVGYSGSIHG